MKRFLICLIAFSSIHSFAQISFENGYLITNSGEKINCQIKNNDWRYNPVEIEYMMINNSEVKTSTIDSITEFAIYDASKYVRESVNIDRSSENLSDLSLFKKPIFEKEVLLLKVLVEGKSNLYEYVDGNLKRYFYNSENSPIEQLVYKSYRTAENNLDKNDKFRQQLWNHLKCENITLNEIKELKYEKKELVNLFSKYHTCHQSDFINYEQKTKRDLFSLTLRPRLNRSSLQIQNGTSEKVDFGSSFQFGIGLEAEFILPFNNNKWSLLFEPTYQYNKSKETISLTQFTTSDYIGEINYHSIEIPFGVRHYIFLENSSRLFMNVSFVIDLTTNSSLDFYSATGLMLAPLEINTRNNLAFGLGYQHKRYSLEIRYQSSRKILGGYLFWDSDYRTISLIAGYSLFKKHN